LAVLPTETVYGLAGDGTNLSVVKKIFELKGRPAHNPLIMHVLGIREAQHISHITPFASKLADSFWPGPLTFVLPKREIVPYEVTAGLDTVALRSPAHPLFRSMLMEVNKPLAAPSANRTNQISPTTAIEVLDEFGEDCPPILDGGNCDIGLESTVLDLSSKKARVLRLGPISAKEIEIVLKQKVETPSDTFKPDGNANKSPGNATKHYAPQTPVLLHKNLQSLIQSKEVSKRDVVIVPFENEIPSVEQKTKQVLSFSSTISNLEIAKNLYSKLRQADKMNPPFIHLSLIDGEEGITDAINDRLTRASSQNPLASQ
jgi:L-threonylcarbamoyladenylate synthase